MISVVVSSAIQLYPGSITPKGIKIISTNIGSDKTKASQKRFDMTSFNDHLPMKHVHSTSIIEFTRLVRIDLDRYGLDLLAKSH